MLPSLVGRDPERLDENEIARAVVESVAENLSDAVVGTALWGVVAGASGATAHRAANTLDAMVGYRTARYRRFGWASARLDDVLGWPAARLTALLVAVAEPRRAPHVWRVVRRDARSTPRRTQGWPRRRSRRRSISASVGRTVTGSGWRCGPTSGTVGCPNPPTSL